MRYKEKLLLVLLGISFLFFYSHMTSPLFPYSYGWDSSFFQLVGGGMTKGLIPYRDFFDMKGPWLFFMEYAGQLFCYGRTGSFILQVLCLTLTIILCHSIFLKYYKGKGIAAGIIMIIPFFIIMSGTIEGGNLTEELSLPFLLFPLYLSLGYIREEEEEHRPGYAVVYGFCFGVLMLLRITNAVLICAIVLTITVFLVINKKWKNLFLNIMGFILGVALAFLLPLLYFGYFGEIKSMLYCTFVFGFIYGTEGFEFGTGMFFMLLLFVPIICLTVVRYKNRRMWLLVFSSIIGMLITLGMGNSTLHDYMLVIPLVMLGIWELISAWRQKKISMAMVRGRILLIILVILFIYPSYKSIGSTVNILSQFNNNDSYNNVMEIAEQIPEQDRNSVLAYETPMRFYAITDIMPSNRYCGWQEHYMRLSAQIENDIDIMFEEGPPKWLVIKTTAIIENEKVISHLKNKYTVKIENEDLRLYRRNE